MLRYRTLPAFALAAAAHAQVSYAIDDGFAETAVSIGANEDAIWLNTFAIEPGGEFIDRLDLAFGRPGGPSSLNARAATALLYSDPTGGSPQDATLLLSVPLTIANANTTTLISIAIPPTFITGGLVIGVFFHNPTSGNIGVAPLDRTAPTLSGRSYGGFGVGLDPANLGAIPAGGFNTMEGFGLAGNFVLRAHAVPAPGACATLAMAALALRRRRCGA